MPAVVWEMSSVRRMFCPIQNTAPSRAKRAPRALAVSFGFLYPGDRLMYLSTLPLPWM